MKNLLHKWLRRCTLTDFAWTMTSDGWNLTCVVCGRTVLHQRGKY
jgi:hypothetical protein